MPPTLEKLVAESLVGKSLDMAAENFGLVRGVGETDRQLSSRMSAVNVYVSLHTEKPPAPSPGVSDAGRGYARADLGVMSFKPLEYKPTTRTWFTSDKHLGMYRYNYEIAKAIELHATLPICCKIANDPDRRPTSWARLLGPDLY